MSFDWNSAIRQHSRKVLNVLLAHGASLAEADDIANDAWMKLIQNHSNGTLSHIDLPGLAIRQAQFLWVDWCRAKSKNSERLSSNDLSENLEFQLIRKEQTALVGRILNQLSPRARDIFQFVYSSPEVPHAVAAKRFGISVQRVRQTLCEVRKYVREKLAEFNHETP